MMNYFLSLDSTFSRFRPGAPLFCLSAGSENTCHSEIGSRSLTEWLVPFRAGLTRSLDRAGHNGFSLHPRLGSLWQYGSRGAYPLDKLVIDSGSQFEAHWSQACLTCKSGKAYRRRRLATEGVVAGWLWILHCFRLQFHLV